MLLFLASLWGCRHVIIEPSMVPTKTVVATTTDGYGLNVRRYQAAGPPVLLVHGLATNHYCFDYATEISLAASLQASGFDVWVTDLRGDETSTSPFDIAVDSQSYDDFLAFDVPAILDLVLSETGEESLYWVGHSLGGMLLLGALPEYGHQLRAGVTLSSALSFAEPSRVAKAAKRIGWSTNNPAIPMTWFGKRTLWMGKRNPVLPIVAVYDNLPEPLIGGLVHYALVDVSSALAHQTTTWLRAGDLTKESGDTVWRQSDTPLLMLGASKDKIVSSADVATTCGQYVNCTYENVEGFGHIDIILGESAKALVYPTVVDFLWGIEKSR